MGGGQRGLSLGKMRSSPGEGAGNGTASRGGKTCTGMDVRKGTMAWELQVLLGTEPVAQEHMWEEPDPIHHNSIPQGADDRLGRGTSLGSRICMIAGLRKMIV